MACKDTDLPTVTIKPKTRRGRARRLCYLSKRHQRWSTASPVALSAAVSCCVCWWAPPMPIHLGARQRLRVRSIAPCSKKGRGIPPRYVPLDPDQDRRVGYDDEVHARQDLPAGLLVLGAFFTWEKEGSIAILRP